MVEIITSWLGLLLMLIGAMATFIGPRAWPAIRNWYSRITAAVLYPFKGTERKVLELAQKHEQVHESIVLVAKKLDDLAEQFKPNGGSSIKDSLNRIEFKQANNENLTGFIINTLDIPVYRTDTKGMCLWVSKSYCELAGATPEDLLGWGWVNFISSKDIDNVRSKWNSAIIERRSFEAQFNIVNNNLLVYSRAVPTYFNNEIVGWVGSWEVIT